MHTTLEVIIITLILQVTPLRVRYNTPLFPPTIVKVSTSRRSLPTDYPHSTIALRPNHV